MGTTVVFAALQWECRPVLRRLGAAERGKVGDFTVWRARTARADVLLLKTGVGLERAARAARLLAGEPDVDVFLSSGCAGALNGDLVPGDLVVAQSIGLAGETALDVHEGQREHASAVAIRAGLRPAPGHVLSSPIILALPEAKRAAALAGAVAVEMEGAAIAREAAGLGIPFVSVRSILDTFETELEGSGVFVDPVSGSIRPLAVASHLIRHPGAIRRMMESKKMMDAAEGSLTRFFAEYL